jgi:DNA-binding CsgD family transcriptional regulator
MDTSVLIERDAQLASLGESLAATRTGRGGLVLVAGEAGVGKTRLVRVAVEAAGVRMLRTESTQEAREPYAPIASLLRTHLLAQEDAAATQLLTVLTGAAEASSATAMVGAISRWLTSLGDVTPTALFLDDVQWADTATVELLPRLVADLELVPVLVVAAYRSDEVMRGHPVRKLRVALRRSGALDEIEVAPLGPDATAELTSRLLGADVSPRLAATVHDRTQGLPFFVEELAAALSAREFLTSGAEGLELRPGSEVPLPDTVRDAVLVRLEQLGEPARAALDVAAVAGLRFELGLVAELGVSGEVDEAVAVGLLEERERGWGAFRHALVREAVYAGVPWTRRRELHGRVAAALERRGSGPRLIAEHWLAAGEREPARAALTAAADASCAVHAYRDAAAAIRTALELWPDDDPDGRLDAVDRLGRCAERAGDLREAARLWEELLAELEPRSLRAARTMGALALAHRLLGDLARATALRAEAADAFEAAEAWAEAFELRLVLVWAYDTGPLEVLLDALAAADEDAERAGRLDLKARARSLRGQMHARRGRFDEGYEIAREGLALAHKSGDAKAIYDAYWYLAAIGVTRGDYTGAAAALEEATAYCRATGLRGDEQFCVACLAKVHFRQGEWDRALDLAAGVLDSPDTTPAGRWAALWTAGYVQAARGRTAEARTLLEELERTGRLLQHPAALAEALVSLGLADEVDGREDAARARYLELVELGRNELTNAHHTAPTVRAAVAYFAERGEAEQVAACTDLLAEVAARFASGDAQAALSHALAEVAALRGDAVEAAARFARALELLHELGWPFDVALTELRAAPAFVGAGDRETGVDLLVNAYRCFRRLGATPLARRAAAALEALGEPVDRRLGRRAAGELERGGLTRRELEILRHVAVGRTNAEIAAELVLSERTVEMHVRNMLAKLGCRSRTEATARAHELNLVATAAPR